MTLLRLVECDGGREAAGRTGVTDRDCATRAVSNGADLPYDEAHDLVNEAARLFGHQGDDPAETGVDLAVADIILARDRGWEPIQPKGAAYMNVEDLQQHLPQPRLNEYPVLVVRTERITRGEARRGINEPVGHLTTVINGEVHDIATLEETTARGHARPDPVTLIYVPPADVALRTAARHADRHRCPSAAEEAEQ